MFYTCKLPKLFYFTLFYFLFPIISFSQQTQKPVYLPQGEITDINGYYESLPAGYASSGKKYPLILFIHGMGELGSGDVTDLPMVLRNGPPKLINNGTFPSSFTVDGKTFSFIVISPQLVSWPTGDELITLNDFLNYLIEKYRVDTTRMYMTGLSMGGGITWEFTGNFDQFAQRMAAIVPIAGASYPAVQRANNIAQNDLPVWAFHNDDDPRVPSSYSIDYVNEINSYNPPPNPRAKLTIFHDDVHGGWETAYDPSYKENNMNAYQWMLQYSRQPDVLPVVLTNFTGEIKKQSIQLEWNTASEISNAYFSLERSLDGNNFTSIATIPGAGTTNVSHHYAYTDAGINKLGTDKLYYRLKQVNTDGHFTYYNVLAISLNDQTFASLQLFPNPANNQFRLTINNIPPQAILLNVYNANGRLIQQQKITRSQTDINLSGKAKGIYLLQLDYPDGSKKILRAVLQ